MYFYPENKYRTCSSKLLRFN